MATTTASNSIGGEEISEVEATFRDLNETEMLSFIRNKSDAEIASVHRNRFGPLYINLLSVFGNELEPEQIWNLAVACTRSSIWGNTAAERYLSHFPSPERKLEFQLSPWNTALLDDLLALGKGLIIYTFRVGLYHFMAHELAALGYPLCSPVIAAKYRTFGKSLARLRTAVDKSSDIPAEEARTLRAAASWTPLLLEDRGTTLRIAQSLRRGEVVLIGIDGNDGVDGPWGESGRVDVPFFGENVSVKNGIARLACFAGSPILPVVAIKNSTSNGTLVYEPALIPPVKSGAAERDRFAEGTMRHLFGMVERYARRYPEAWDGAAGLHRWRRGARKSARD